MYWNYKKWRLSNVEKLLNKSNAGGKVSSILTALEEIEAAMSGAATRNPRAAVKKTISFLQPHKEKSVEAFIGELGAQAVKPAARKTSSVALRKGVVDEHLAALNRGERSVGEFENALSALKGDKRVRMTELAEIVKGYTGSTAKPKRKAEGYDVIDHAFDQRWKLRNR